VRTSGATVVVEGCGSNGCEYMTGGAAVILGAVGQNFGAGMTGGMAFLYDPHQRFALMANPETILWRPVVTDHWIKVLRDLIEEHVRRTGSLQGKTILDNWQLELRNFVHVVPKESVARLAAPLELKAAE
jgi:glutamate synthase (NADPH/NADH) large chain